MVVVEVDQEIGKIRRMLGLDVIDQLLGGNPFFLRAQHDRRAVGIVRTHINALIAAQLLKTHPYVSLNVLKHMPQMDGSIGIGQGAGNQNLTRFAVAGHGHSASLVTGGKGGNDSRVGRVGVWRVCFTRYAGTKR